MGYTSEKMRFNRKGMGCIVVEKAEDVSKVREIIKKMDEYEYEYLPDDLVKPLDQFLAAVKYTNGKLAIRAEGAYTHKFDSIDLNELQIRCWVAGIRCFVFMGYNPENNLQFYDAWNDWTDEEFFDRHFPSLDLSKVDPLQGVDTKDMAT